MGDHAASGEGGDQMDPTDAFGVARDLLHGAELDADHTRADAERYARQRELEADLLVQKARRLLLAAEEKATVIVATARAHSPVDDVLIDLDALGHVIAPDAAGLGDTASPTRLDEMLASAIAHAVTDAFPLDEATAGAPA
jgi:hypothetical protein